MAGNNFAPVVKITAIFTTNCVMRFAGGPVWFEIVLQYGTQQY